MIPAGALKLGLGCAHIASLSTKASSREINRLLDQAWDGGMRLFDTADIYGQGDSERRLARIATRPGAVIVTKAGLALSRSQGAIRLVKPLLRPLLQQARGARQAAASARARAERHDLDPASLERRLEASLKRLNCDHVAAFLLHAPPLAELQAVPALFDALAAIKTRGLAERVGVSVQHLSNVAPLLKHAPLDALQIPLRAADLPAQKALLEQAQNAGISVIAREVLGGASPADALPPLLASPQITSVLIGTTNSAHLAQNLAVAQC